VNFSDHMWIAVSAFAAGTAAIGLAAALVIRNRSSAYNRNIAMVLMATALNHICAGIALIDESHAVVWWRLSLMAGLLQPVALLYFGLVFMKPGSELVSARWRARAVLLLGGMLGALVWWNQIHIRTSPMESFTIEVGRWSNAFYVFILFATAVGLSQLEYILRAARDPVRYQIKFIVIGLGAIGAYAVYQAGQLIMLPVWRVDHLWIGSMVALVATGLMTYGLGRIRLREAASQLSISPQALYGSVTFLGIGLYLLALGIVGEIILRTGAPLSVDITVVVMFIGGIGLLVLIFSRTVRATMRRFVARHFYRAKYDYRAKWLEVTEAFRASTSVPSILDRFIELMGRTFGAERISIWMRFESDGRFHQVRSMNTQPAPDPIPASHPIPVRLAAADEVLNTQELGLSSFDSMNDPFLKATQALLCAPICSENRLIAFVTLSRESRDEQYGQDDFDLLRAIAHHAGMLLSNARWAEERTAATEMEALHRLSAFCLHDLKNLAAKLSMVVQNAGIHGQDPAFQQSAMRTVAGTVNNMMELIGKLSLKEAQSGTPEFVDVRAVVSETVGSFDSKLPISLRNIGDQTPVVCIDRERLQQILLNVLLNAQQGIESRSQRQDNHGEIRINTEWANRKVIITVSDTGCGMRPDKLRTLFRPFQTTKANGLGIGLYQCKRLVEEYGGTIHASSKWGEGTEIRIELPLAMIR
jgi:putative PEP-CTERM system histidine kinase